MNSQTPILFQGTVAAGGTLTMEESFENAGTITRLYSKAYVGEETSVRRYFQLLPGGREDSPVNLVTAATDADEDSEEFLAGNDQEWDFPMRRQFPADSRLRVRFENQDANNAYPVHAIVNADREGVASVLSSLAGVLS